MPQEQLVIRDYAFPGADQAIADTPHGTNWPVVYLLYSDKEVYVGETTSAYVRYGQHANSKGKFYDDRKRLNRIKIIFDDKFNKSAILDIEQKLISLLETDSAMQSASGLKGRKLQNRNAGQSYSHDYYNRSIYQATIEEIWSQLYKKQFVKNSYSSIKNSDLFKYSPYTSLTAEQELVCRNVIRDMISALQSGRKGMTIIKGAAGTGKSLVLINMIMTLLRSMYINYDYDFETDSEDDLDERYSLHAELERFYGWWKEKTGRKGVKIGFVLPMSSIRDTFKMVFRHAGKSTKGMTVSMVIGPNEVVTKDGEEYDIVFVDEAHRLKRRVAMSGTEMHAFDNCCKKLGLDSSKASQLDFLLMKTKYQVLVYDENQSIKPTDIPALQFNEIIKKHVTLRQELKSQMRCLGGTDFMQYVADIFDLKNPMKTSFSDGFEFRLFDDPNELIGFINQMDAKEQLCRTLAGYSWKWVSANGNGKLSTLNDYINAGRKPDIVFDGKPYYWNIKSSQWILNSSPQEIGCVHTSQGYDLNRVGVIFGREIDYNPSTNTIDINRKLFYDSKVKQQTNDEQLKKFIINAYKVMMVRGIKGCYIYACNKNLRDYLKRFV